MVNRRGLRWAALVLAMAPLVGCEAPDPPPPAAEDPPPAGLSVELADVKTETDGPGGRGQFSATVRFRNGTPDPVWVLRPLDGSKDGRLMPYYRLTVTGPKDPDEPLARMCAFCGRWANTEWPKDYLVEVPAFGTAGIQKVMRGRLSGPGRYVLQFEYVYLPEAGAGTPIPEQDLTPPAQAWRGRAVAPPLELDYTPDPNWRPLPEDLPADDK